MHLIPLDSVTAQPQPEDDKCDCRNYGDRT